MTCTTYRPLAEPATYQPGQRLDNLRNILARYGTPGSNFVLKAEELRALLAAADALQDARNAFYTLANLAQDEEEWNEGGEAFEASQAVKKAVAGLYNMGVPTGG